MATEMSPHADYDREAMAHDIRTIADPETGPVQEEALCRVVPVVVDIAFMVANRRGMTPFDSDDIAQDTVVKVWQRAETYNGGNPHAWVAVIARNRAIDYARSSSRRRWELTEDTSHLPDASLIRADGDLPAGIFLDGLLSALKPDYSDVVRLLADGYRSQEIAEITGVPEGTAKSRIHRARNKVRGILVAAE